MKLFTEFNLGSITLKNRIVMSPMTRSRAIDNIPNDMMAEYYALRANTGLIITEGTAPSPNGLGYPRIPGIFNQEQIEGWQKVTSAVHAQGGKIFLQIMHTGRIGHPDNMADDAEILGPSAIAAAGDMYTDKSGPQPHPTPRAMTIADIKQTQQEYVQAAQNAITAGFDGVELHGANGYLIDQFINPGTNQRSDEYGGSHQNRARFALEVAAQVADAIGPDRTGIRLSPYGVFNDVKLFDETEEAYEHLAAELGKLDLAYIHIVDHSSQGAPTVEPSVKRKIRDAFGGTIIASGGLTKDSAEAILQNDEAELTAFGTALLANPDLVYRFKHDLDLNTPDSNTFFTPGPEGYLDYPLAKPETSELQPA
ncbi:MAG TPA: alkene reductase [Anaerolineae bacterium]|nr:alkene reductase [Anaerolineae bacterium]